MTHFIQFLPSNNTTGLCKMHTHVYSHRRLTAVAFIHFSAFSHHQLNEREVSERTHDLEGMFLLFLKQSQKREGDVKREIFSLTFVRSKLFKTLGCSFSTDFTSSTMLGAAFSFSNLASKEWSSYHTKNCEMGLRYVSEISRATFITQWKEGLTLRTAS